jgi:hypothetical protein
MLQAGNCVGCYDWISLNVADYFGVRVVIIAEARHAVPYKIFIAVKIHNL